MSGFYLERFLQAQEESYPRALEEIRNGLKTSHWIWYIFPQIRGLGESFPARYYAIENVDEARAYLDNTVLRTRLEEISAELLEHQGKDIVEIFGELDAMKVRSCMTLFATISQDGSVFHEVLDAFFGGEEDTLTIQYML